MLSTKPLPGPFGVEIEGIDLSKLMSDELQRELMDLFHEHQVLVVRDQSLEFEEFDRLTKCFGRQDAHFLDHLRMRGHPAILMLSNIFEEDHPIGVFEGAAFWHTDVAYRDPPNSATIVYALECPEGGCPTGFADAFGAYDALPQPMQERIDDMMVLHHYGNRDDMDEDSRNSAERLTPEQKQNVRNVFHPLVKRHPITGRKALYGVAGSSFGIVGMPDDEAVALLDEYSAGAGLAFNRGIYALAHDTWSGDVSLRGDLVTNDELEWTGQFRFVRYDGNLPVRDPGATRVPLDPNARNARSRIVSSIGARFEPSAAWSHELKGTLYWESFLFSDRFDDVILAEGDPFVFDASFDFDTSLRRPGLEYAGTYRHDADEARGLTLSYGARVEREELGSAGMTGLDHYEP